MLISKNFLTREASYKPSCLISWNQSGPVTAGRFVGMQNSKGLNMRRRYVRRNGNASGAEQWPLHTPNQ